MEPQKPVKTVDRKAYKLLKKALKIERSNYMTLEAELMNKIEKVSAQGITIEQLKDKNIDLQVRIDELEELTSNLRQTVLINKGGNMPDSEHMKEILGAQTLLREEMKEKEFFKAQASKNLEKMLQIEDEMLIK